MLEIKKMLQVRNVEDFFGKRMLFQIVVLVFLLYLSFSDDLQLRICAHLFSLLWISINACQVFTLFRRKKCDFLFCESPVKDGKRFNMFLKVCYCENILFVIYTYLFFTIFMGTNLLKALLFTLLHISFAIAIGVFCAQLRNNVADMLVISAFYVVCFIFSQSWTMDEFFRYLSPTVQLYNVHKVNSSNNFALLTLIVILILFAKHVMGLYKSSKLCKALGLTFVCLCCFGMIIRNEVAINNRNNTREYQIQEEDGREICWRNIDQNSVIMLSNVLDDMEKELSKLGMWDEACSRYEFNRYYVSYLNNLYKTRSVPISIENQTVCVNIFSDAMLNFEEDYMVSDFINRAYDQYNSQIKNVDNPYVYQIVEGCREHIYISVIEGNPDIQSDALVRASQQLIERRNEGTVTRWNFLKKIINILYDENQEQVTKLFTYTSSVLPENEDEVKQMLEKYCPELLEDDDIQNIMERVTRGK